MTIPDGLRLALAGELVAAGGNRPFFLAGPDAAWLVESGRLEIFAVRLQDREPVGARIHICPVPAGGLVLGMDPDFYGKGVGLLAVGMVGTSVRRIESATLRRLAAEPQHAAAVAGLLEGWVSGLSAGVKKELPPKSSRLLESGSAIELAKGESARARHGVVWVRHRSGTTLFARWGVLDAETAPHFPVSEHTWLVAAGAVALDAVDTAGYFAEDPQWSALDGFHQLILDGVVIQSDLAEFAERQRLDLRLAADRASARTALQQLAGVLAGGAAAKLAAATGDDPLLAACRLVADDLEQELTEPPAAARAGRDPIGAIAQASGLRIREVTLDSGWWQHDSGPLVGARKEDGRPVALIPGRGGRYLLHDPQRGTVEPLAAAAAATLDQTAVMFYRSFPDRPLTDGDILKFVVFGLRRELGWILSVSLLAGLVALLVPVVTGQLVGTIIPSADRGLLLQYGLGLLVATLTGTIFQLARSFVLLRVETRVDSSLQAAVWDRLLKLPVPFFRQFSVGDLTVRAGGITAIRHTLSTAVLTALLSSLFSATQVILLFYYDRTLAAIACGLIAVAAGVIVTAAWYQVRYQREIAVCEGRLSGMVLQFLTGISKLRASAAELRAFAVWAKGFATQRAISVKARKVTNRFSTFNALYPSVAQLVLFGWVGYTLLAAEAGAMSTADFLAFNAAFGAFLMGVLAFCTTLIGVLAVVPMYERARPILAAVPEAAGVKSPPGELSGEIEISRLSFRYAPGMPLILDDVSLRVPAGKFVAVVGPSGSGKSTLLRLLLGFEKPETGAIHYDGQALDELDLRAVRRQMGVVLQNGRLLAGDIFTNIVGVTRMTIDDAWDAARRAGLAEDIEAMPMGMHTFLSEGGSTLSGGQRQRLLIARALIVRPRIIFFDEATSALDNITQAVVSKSLEELQTTRVVIAHRLSTIVKADLIVVLVGGKVAEQGTYAELMAAGGMFSELARRQMA